MTSDLEYHLKIKQLLKSNPRGMTISALSKKLKINRNSVSKYLEILLSFGHVDRMEYGPSKVYFLSQRVPVSSLLNFSQEMVIILNKEKRIIQINDRFLRCLKERRESLLGQAITDVSIPLIRTLADLKILKESNMEKEEDTELNFLISGKKFYFKIKSLPTIFEDGGHGLTIIIENITQQKHYEQDLKQSEARYRAIVEDQSELICRRLSDGTITFVNGAFSRYFGKKPEELLGMKFHSLIPAAEQNQILEGNAADNRFLRNSTYEQRVVLENGAIQWLQWSDNKLYDKTGILNEIQSVGKDITLQKDREKEIIIKESVVASSNHAIAIIDIMGRVVFANRSFISMMGYEDEHEVIGEPLEKFVQRTGIQDNISQITAAMIHQGEWNGTETARKKDGKEFELEVYASMITEDKHFPRSMIALFNDGKSRSDIKRHISVIKNSDQSDKEGIAVIDPAGKIIYINGNLLDLTGYTEEREILGKSIAVLIDNESVRPTGFSDFMNNRTGRDGWSGEVSITQKDGSSLPTWLSAKRTSDAQGIPYSIQISFRDSSVQISDKMFLEEFPEKIREMIEFIPYPTFVIDPERRVFAWNRALELMTNVKRQDIIGTNNYAKAFSFYQGSRPILVDLLGLSAEEIAHKYPKVRQFGDGIFIEGFIPPYDGVNGAYLWGKASPLLDPNGNYIGAIESIQDISDWKKVQESFKRMRDEINVTFLEKIQQLRLILDRGDKEGSDSRDLVRS